MSMRSMSAARTMGMIMGMIMGMGMDMTMAGRSVAGMAGMGTGMNIRRVCVGFGCMS